MLRWMLAVLLCGLLASAAMLAQSRGNERTARDDDRERTMNGCIAQRAAPQEPLTFQDTSTGFWYRVTGRNLGRFAGQRVEIVGVTPVPKRFVVRGGLYPSPNVAGQAGDIDPAKAAIARMPGGPESGTGSVELLPEFRVTRVRIVEGACG